MRHLSEMSMKLSVQANVFLYLAIKYASDTNDAAPEFEALKQRPVNNSELWWGNSVAKYNTDRYFAILDESIIKEIKKNQDLLGLDSHEDIIRYYLDNPKTQELISFICDSYNKYFPKVNSEKVHEFLMNDGSLDPDSGASSRNPIFILVHDLMHQVLQADFTDSLHQQNDRDSNGEMLPKATLLDELNEDIASSLSNFEPENGTQGLIYYVGTIFRNNINNKDISEQSLKATIETTFYMVKAELRGKIDRISKEHPVHSSNVPAKLKQMVDGFLSRMKNEMLKQVPDVVETVANDEDSYKFYTGRYSTHAIWDLFNLYDLRSQYFERINEYPAVDQADSSALRGWMMECLRKMKQLYDYFKNLKDELYAEHRDEDEESPHSAPASTY